MRSVIAANAIGFLALLGFAGAASASATIDLIWENSGTDTTSSVGHSHKKEKRNEAMDHRLGSIVFGE
jgi:hypothetical protein